MHGFYLLAAECTHNYNIESELCLLISLYGCVTLFMVAQCESLENTLSDGIIFICSAQNV